MLYFLPVIGYLLYLFAEPASVATIVNIGDFMNLAGFGVLTDNVVYTVLNSIFGANGVLPAFAGTAVISYFTWFIFVYVLHVLVDILIFIPRLAHKWMNSFTRSEE